MTSVTQMLMESEMTTEMVTHDGSDDDGEMVRMASAMAIQHH